MNREFVYHSATRSFCTTCGKLVDGKIVCNNTGVFVLKTCPVCGTARELLEEDPAFHLKKASFDRSGTATAVSTDVRRGCPFDCGLCPQHDQHTCIGLIEITDRCNMSCPMCYAKSGGTNDLSLETASRMMDFYIEAEGGKAEILQISGGEPTLHPDVLQLIQMARDKGIPYVMLNTNGMRIAQDESFVRELARFRGGFEVYLQYDGDNDGVYERLRGAKLVNTKREALRNLAKYRIPTTLVATIEQGVNDHLVGEILVTGMRHPCVRGVNYQPVGYYGEKAAPADRVTLSGVLRRMERQTNGMVRMGDFVPLPCNVERVAITFLFHDKKGYIPVTRDRDLSEFRGMIGNTFLFTVEDTLKSFTEDSTIFGTCACCDFIADIKKYLPESYLHMSEEEKIRFVDENTFRISVSSFVDKYNFDLKSMQKECVHIITEDLRRIPFSSYNMLHRG